MIHSKSSDRGNFENALMHASGDIILLADQDDIWLSQKLRTFKSELKNCDLISSDAYLIEPQGQRIGQKFYGELTPITNLARKIIKIRYHGCTMAFKRELLEIALPFPSEMPIHDGWLGLLAELTGTVNHIPTALTEYRIHQSNTSNTKNSLFYKIHYRFYLFKELYKRYKIYNPETGLPAFLNRLNNPVIKN